MRRFSKTLYIETTSEVVDLLEYNFTCHRAGDHRILGSALWVPTGSVPTVDDVSKSTYIITRETVLAVEEAKAVLDIAIAGGSVVGVLDPAGELPAGYLSVTKVAISSVPAEPTADILILTGLANATEQQISDWVTFLADKTNPIGVEASNTIQKSYTIQGMLVGADFVVKTTAGAIEYYEQFDLFMGTSVKSVGVDVSLKTIVTDSHTVTYDNVEDILLARGELCSIGDNSLQSNQQVLVRTAASSVDLEHAEFFAYSSNTSLKRYVQFKATNPEFVFLRWEVSDEVNLVKSPSADTLVEMLPEWMTWRTDPRSAGRGIIESVTQLSDELRLAGMEVRQIPTDMPIHLMNGIASEEWVEGDGYVDAANYSGRAMANSPEELIYSPVPAYMWVDGYIIHVVLLNGDPINLWTPLDEWGAYAGLSRHTGESLARFRLRVLDAFQSEHGSHKDAFLKTIIRELSPIDGESPDEFSTTADVDVLNLTDPSLLDSEGFPGDAIRAAVQAQKLAGQHVYDDGVMGRVIWNANGPGHEGGARIPHRYDTPLELIDDIAASGTGPDDDCKVLVGGDQPIDAIVTVKKTLYGESNTANGVYPLTIAAVMKKTGSYNEYITPMMRATVRASLYLEALDVTATADFVITGDSSKNAVNSEPNSNTYQVNLVNANTGLLEGVWTYVKDTVTKVLSEEEMAAAWDVENAGPLSTVGGGKELFKLEVISAVRLDTDASVTAGAKFDVLDQDTYANSSYVVTSTSQDKTGYTYFDVKFKDDLGTEVIDWVSDNFTYELKLNCDFDVISGQYVLGSEDFPAATDIPVPTHISNAATSVEIISVTADLNTDAVVDITGVSLAASNGTFNITVPMPVNLRYPLVQHTEDVTTTDTINVADIMPGETRQLALSPKDPDGIYDVDCDTNEVRVSYNAIDHLVTVSRVRADVVMVNPGWFWLSTDEDYLYTDGWGPLYNNDGLHGSPINGTEKTPSHRPAPNTKITVEGYVHRYALTPLGAKTFNVELELTSNGSDELVIPDKNVADVVVTFDGATELVEVVDGVIILPGNAIAGEVFQVSYRLKDSFYYDWLTNKLVLSDEATDVGYEIQKSDDPMATALSISPHDTIIDDYFIVLDDTDTDVPDIVWGVSSKSKVGRTDMPLCVVVQTRYIDGSVAPDVSYDLEVTNGVCAGDLLDRKTGSDGSDIVDIWPTGDVTVKVKSGATILGTLVIYRDTTNTSSLPAAERVDIIAPTSLRMNFPVSIPVRAWASIGDPDEAANGTWKLEVFELDESGDAVGTAYTTVVNNTAFVTSSTGRYSIPLTANQLSKRGAYKLTVTVNSVTSIAVWRIY